MIPSLTWAAGPQSSLAAVRSGHPGSSVHGVIMGDSTSVSRELNHGQLYRGSREIAGFPTSPAAMQVVNVLHPSLARPDTSIYIKGRHESYRTLESYFPPRNGGRTCQADPGRDRTGTFHATLRQAWPVGSKLRPKEQLFLARPAYRPTQVTHAAAPGCSRPDAAPRLTPARLEPTSGRTDDVTYASHVRSRENTYLCTPSPHTA
ncbi:hypothetical protein Bbelb_172210 [Branchiostoma belcheri]|nr:hypothetical protein Bbelb_172210 [Branchiostoma belcheri]